MEELKKGKGYEVPSLILTLIITIKVFYSGMIPEILILVGIESGLPLGVDNRLYVVWVLMFLDFMVGVTYTKVNDIRKEEKGDTSKVLNNGLMYLVTMYMFQIVFTVVGSVILGAVGIVAQGSLGTSVSIILGIALGANLIGMVVRVILGKGVLAYLVHNSKGKTKYREALRFAFKNFSKIMKVEAMYFMREVWGLLMLGVGYVFTKARALSYKTEDWEVLVNGGIEKDNKKGF